MAKKICKKVDRATLKPADIAKAEIEQLISGIKKKLEEKNGAKKAALIIEELIKKKKKPDK